MNYRMTKWMKSNQLLSMCLLVGAEWAIAAMIYPPLVTYLIVVFILGGVTVVQLNYLDEYLNKKEAGPKEDKLDAAE